MNYCLIMGWYRERMVGYIDAGPKCAVWKNNVPEEEIQSEIDLALPYRKDTYPVVIFVAVPEEWFEKKERDSRRFIRTRNLPESIWRASVPNYFRATVSPAVRNKVDEIYKRGVRGQFRFAWEDGRLSDTAENLGLNVCL